MFLRLANNGELPYFELSFRKFLWDRCPMFIMSSDQELITSLCVVVVACHLISTSLYFLHSLTGLFSTSIVQRKGLITRDSNVKVAQGKLTSIAVILTLYEELIHPKMKWSIYLGLINN